VRSAATHLFKPVSVGQSKDVAAGRPWWQFATTPSKGFTAAGIWVIVALLQLLSSYSSHSRLSMLIAAGGAMASFILAVGNLASAIVLNRRQRSQAAAHSPARPGHRGPTAGK
jgi:hypothetical protein